MAITVNISITADTDQQFTDLEKGVIGQLLGGSTLATPASEAPAPATAEPEEKPAAPKRTRRTKAQIEADKAAEEAVAHAVASAAAISSTEEEPKTLQEELAEDDDDLLGDDEPETYTVQDAVKLATEMVAEGRKADVKDALAAAGVAKVSLLKGAAISSFVTTLKG